ncbi:MAG: GNAT family N-acetyltransferase [Huintestinicola sp.]
MVYNTYINVQQAVEWLKFIETNAKDYHFGFVRKFDGKLIGSGSIGRDLKGDGFWGFGYNFRYDCWGSGYATEAVKAMKKYAYDNLGARKFTASHPEPNKASGRVMENAVCILSVTVNLKNCTEAVKCGRWYMKWYIPTK